MSLGIALALCGCTTSELNSFQQALNAQPQEVSLIENRYWVGQAYQPKAQNHKNWTMAGYIVPEGHSRMSYPSLGCAAGWQFKQRQAGGKLVYRENVYDDPRNSCVKSLDVSVRAVDASTVEYLAYNSGGQITAKGILKPAPVPIPQELEGNWAGFTTNTLGKKTEIQLRLRRNEQSFSHQFAGSCTAELFYISRHQSGLLQMDMQPGESEMSGASCQQGMLVTIMPAGNDMIVHRTYVNQSLASEEKLKRVR